MLKFVDFGMFIDANAALLQDKSAWVLSIHF
jgi:hypothetical protein